MSPDELIAKIEEAMRRIGPRVPEIDPHDLSLILQSILHPVGRGRVFLLRGDGGKHVF